MGTAGDWVKRGFRAVVTERRLPYSVQRFFSREYYLQKLCRLFFRLVRSTPAVECSQSSGVEAITLLDKTNIDPYLITIKSFFLYSGLRPQVTIISDGSLTQTEEQILERHVRGVRIIPWENLDPTSLRAPQAMRDMCHKALFNKRVFCPPLSGLKDTLIFLDSDVVFRNPIDPDLTDLSAVDLKYNQD